MRPYSPLPIPERNPFPVYKHMLGPGCSLCNQPVPLENAKTDEYGLAVHEECYVLKLSLRRDPANSVLWEVSRGLPSAGGGVQ